MRWVIFTLLMVVSLGTVAEELPELSFKNENHVLKNFPLGASKTEVFEHWGTPRGVISGLPLSSEVWIYETPPKDSSNYYEVIFRDDAVYDVVSKSHETMKAKKSAREKQGGT